MESFYGRLFLDLQERIISKMPEITLVEQNFGQYEFEDFRGRVSFPCVLIDFPDTAYTNLSGGSQLALPIINVMLIFEAFSQSYHYAPTEVKEMALSYYDIEHRLNKCLHGFDGEYFQALSRTNVKSQNKNAHGVRIRDLFYTSEFEDMADEERYF